MYWAYLIQRDLVASSRSKMPSEAEKGEIKEMEEKKGETRKVKIPSQCTQCGQNHYWCQCSRLP